MSIHREAGQAVYVHECEHRRHALTVGWGAGYPALDVNSMPQIVLPDGSTRMCRCGGEYQRVEPCAGRFPHGLDENGNPDGKGDHECHPIAGHVEQSDDPTANLIDSPLPDPDEEELRRLEALHARLQAEHVAAELERRVAEFDYRAEFGEAAELHQVADQLALARQRQLLKGFAAQTAPNT